MMKMIITLSLVLTLVSISSAQDFRPYLSSIAEHYKLSMRDVDSYVISNQYYREETEMEHIYLQQTVHEIPIFNAILQLHIHKGKELVFHNSRFVANAAARIDTAYEQLSMKQTLQIVQNELGLELPENLSIIPSDRQKFIVNSPELLIHPVRIKKIYFHNNNNLILAHEIAIDPKNSLAFTFIISASNGSVLWKRSRTLTCQFDHEQHNESCSEHHESQTQSNKNRNLGEAVYTAYPFGVESPIHGARVSLNAVELPTASPYGWHDVNGAPGAEFDYTRGNNVYAHEDTNDLDIPGYSPSGGPDLVFDFPYLQSEAPNMSLDASITNLFVWNNYLHDLSYFYGFDEESGNFQQTNYSGAGAGEDFVFAHALDGSGNNNANFGTPEEGLNPIMQMYIWEHFEGAMLEILEPSSIAGLYETGASVFGVPPPPIPFTAEVILVSDGSANPTVGCAALTNAAELLGKIAYFDRGTCPYTQKVINAQNAGAIGVIIANNQQGSAMTMGGNDNGAVVIPAISVSQSDGVLIKQQLNSNVTVLAEFGGETEYLTFDSSFDNGIIAHEYGHGISNRLTGGAFEVNCLTGDEQMGEGWSDFFALIVSDTIGATSQMPRGIGNFASNRPADAFGIRPFPYTTDMNINPLTYENIQNLSIPHGVGSVWATMLWDMYWAFVDAYGHSHDIYSNTGGNNKAIRLVMEGMRLQACNPGFVDGRDAILAADDFLYNSENTCLIWETFARRGLGFGASQGLSESVGDETESFDLPPFCLSQLPSNDSEVLPFVIYPNPGNDYLVVKSGSLNINGIQVIDISGNRIATYEAVDSSVEIDASTWSKGVYFIQIQSQNHAPVLRWLKN